MSSSAHGFGNNIKEEERRGNKKNRMAIKVLGGQYKLVPESNDLHRDVVFREGAGGAVLRLLLPLPGSKDDKECGIIYGRGHFNAG